MMDTETTGKVIETLPIKEAIIKGNAFNSRMRFLNHMNPIEGKQGKLITVVEYDNPGASVIIPEKGEANLRDLKFTGHKTKLKRFSEYFELSDELDSNNEVINIDLMKKMAVSRLFHGIENQLMFKGYQSSDTEETKKINFERLFAAENIAGNSKKSEPLNYIDVSQVHKSMMKMGKYNEAVWLINNTAAFSVLDDKGNEKLNFDNVPDGADATLFGRPVYMISTMMFNDGKDVAFGMVHPDAYALSMSDIKVIEPDLDTYQGLARKKVYVVEILADGIVTDQYSKLGVGFAPNALAMTLDETPVEVAEEPVKKTVKKTAPTAEKTTEEK